MKKKNKKKTKMLKLTLVIFLLLAALAFYYFSNKSYEIVSSYKIEKSQNIFFEIEKTRIPTKALVFNPREKNLTLGFSTEAYVLDFGIIPGNGSYSKKYLDLENFYENRTKVEVKVFGNISSKIYLPLSNFWLEGKEKKRIEIYFFTNQTISGYYEGEVDVIVKRPRYSFVYDLDKMLGGILWRK